MTESLPRGYKPWIIASVAVLVLSLVLLAGTVVASFVYFNAGGSPLWVVVMGGFAVFGVVLGFAGFLGMMTVAGWRSFKEGRRVQVIAPEHKAQPEANLRPIALQYFKHLCDSGYFSTIHENSASTWFPELPACKDVETQNRVATWLQSEGYLRIEWLPEARMQALHPKDTLDAWWFVLTDKGAAACRDTRF